MERAGSFYDVDLFVAIAIKRWRLALVVFVIVVIAGVISAFYHIPSFQFVTVLEIGSRLANGQDGRAGTLHWEPETVAAEKVQNVYVAQAISSLETSDKSKSIPDVSAKVRDRTPGIIYLTSTGPLQDRSLHQQIHSAVVALVVSGHGQISDLEREAKERALLAAKGDVEMAKAQEKSLRLRSDQLAQENADRVRDIDAAIRMLELRRSRISDSEKLLERELATLTVSIDKLSMNQSAAIQKNDNNEPRAMTMLMLGNEIQQYRARYASLEERLQVALPKEQDAIDRELVSIAVQKGNLARDYEASKEKIAEQIAEVTRLVGQRDAAVQGIVLQLKNFLDTRVIGLATPSRSPVGTSRMTILLLTLLAGVLLPLLAVFSLETLVQFKSEYLARRQQGHIVS